MYISQSFTYKMVARSSGIDMEQNYVIVTLFIAPVFGRGNRSTYRNWGHVTCVSFCPCLQLSSLGYLWQLLLWQSAYGGVMQNSVNKSAECVKLIITVTSGWVANGGRQRIGGPCFLFLPTFVEPPLISLNSVDKQSINSIHCGAKSRPLATEWCQEVYNVQCHDLTCRWIFINDIIRSLSVAVKYWKSASILAKSAGKTIMTVTLFKFTLKPMTAIFAPPHIGLYITIVFELSITRGIMEDVEVITICPIIFKCLTGTRSLGIKVGHQTVKCVISAAKTDQTCMYQTNYLQ